jgi:hypothetical protein
VLPVVGQPNDLTSVRCDLEELEILANRSSERDPTAVGREGGIDLEPIGLRDTPTIRSIGADREEVVIAVCETRVDDPSVVARESGARPCGCERDRRERQDDQGQEGGRPRQRNVPPRIVRRR